MDKKILWIATGMIIAFGAVGIVSTVSVTSAHTNNGINNMNHQ